MTLGLQKVTFKLNDVTSSRSFDTVYQAGSRPLLLLVSLYRSAAGYTAQCYVDSVNPPTTLQVEVGNAATVRQEIVAYVPAWYYYEIPSFGGGSTLIKWVEITL